MCAEAAIDTFVLSAGGTVPESPGLGGDVSRSAREVFEDHLRIAVEGGVEDDIERNYDSNVVILSREGVRHGYDCLREEAAKMQRELPNCTFHYHTRLVEGDVAFLEWTAEADGARVRDGVDSYLIHDGRITAQTIHYTVEAIR
jgi:hypothetical protein